MLGARTGVVDMGHTIDRRYDNSGVTGSIVARRGTAGGRDELVSKR